MLNLTESELSMFSEVPDYSEDCSRGYDNYRYIVGYGYRYGCGYIVKNDEYTAYAFHGYPSRNEDYFTTVKISEQELEEILEKYPKCEIISRTKQDWEEFGRKYINDHEVMLRGMDQLL